MRGQTIILFSSEVAFLVCSLHAVDFDLLMGSLEETTTRIVIDI